MRSKREKWIDDLPRSRMEYPDLLLEKVRYWIWTLYTPLHPYVRDFVTMIGLMRHEGRQEYLLGTLNAAYTAQEVANHLISQGFGNHFVAWKDTDELVSLRKTEGFRYQYHVRIFKDGEIRCHYEYTPEYRPIQHLVQTGFQNRNAEFAAMLKDWINPPEQTASV